MRVVVGNAVACEALNCKAVLPIELAGGKDMEIRTNKERDFQLSGSTVFSKLGLSCSL